MRDRDFFLLISALLAGKLARKESLVILKIFEPQLDATVMSDLQSHGETAAFDPYSCNCNSVDVYSRRAFDPYN